MKKEEEEEEEVKCEKKMWNLRRERRWKENETKVCQRMNEKNKNKMQRKKNIRRRKIRWIRRRSKKKKKIFKPKTNRNVFITTMQVVLLLWANHYKSYKTNRHANIFQLWTRCMQRHSVKWSKSRLCLYACSL